MSIFAEPSIIQVVGSQSAVTVIPGPSQVITQGIQGPPGPPGTGATAMAVLGEDLAAFTAVVMISGQLFAADPTNSAHAPLFVGLTTEAGLMGQNVTYAVIGEVTGNSGLTLGERYFLGVSGSLSTSPVAPGATWMRYIGTAQSTTILVLVGSVSVLLD